jgi:hypothetical protein
LARLRLARKAQPCELQLAGKAKPFRTKERQSRRSEEFKLTHNQCEGQLDLRSYFLANAISSKQSVEKNR